MRRLNLPRPGKAPAIPSSPFLSHRCPPSRLPFGSLRSALTGPGRDAEQIP